MPIRWEDELYKAHATFQAQIPEAAACDVVIAIFRARLGSPLPADFAAMPDGEPYPSGTAYEVLTAIAARQHHDLPDVYVFRNPEPPSIRLDDPARAEIEGQWQGLKAFFDRWFRTPEGQFKAAFQTFSSTDDFERQAENALRQWIAEHVHEGRTFVWSIAQKGSPFRGLEPFGAKHAPVFFGRDRETAKAIDALKDAAERGIPFLLLLGPSGSGKSSLARAGLVPGLTAPGMVPSIDVWRVAVMRPSEGASPVAALAARLFDGPDDIKEEDKGRPFALPELAEGDYPSTEKFAGALAHDDDSAVQPILRALEKVAEAARTREGYNRPVNARLLLVVDQLDDLFAVQVPEEARTAFARLLARLIASGQVWIVATLRDELYSAFQKETSLHDLKEKGASLDVRSPGPAELVELVRGPAEAAGLSFEKNASTGETLDERLLRDAERGDLLPLLQFTLNRLFGAREGARLTFAAYAALGGIEGAVDKEAESAISALPQEAQAKLGRLLRQLATRSQGALVAAGLDIRPVPLAEAEPDAPSRQLVAALVNARILLTSGWEGAPTLRLAHARVLESWRRAKTIASESADFYRVRDEIEEQFRRWKAANEQRDLLIPSGLPLAEAENIVKRFGGELSDAVRKFIELSARRARAFQRLLAAAAVSFLGLAIVAGGAGYIALRKQKEAIARLYEALELESRFRAEQSRAQLKERYPVEAVLLAMAGLPDLASSDETQKKRPFIPEAQDAYNFAFGQLAERKIFVGHHDVINTAAFSPDGRRIVTASGDRTARLWDVETGKPIGEPLKGHEDVVWSAAFSPDGRRIVTASEDDTARLWDAETGKPIGEPLKGHEGQVRGAVFSPDGRRIVTASMDRTARLWDAETGKPIGEPLKGHEDAVSSAAFSPDGRRIVTASVDKTARLWDAETGKPLGEPLKGHEGLVLSAAFSPDGRRIVTASVDRTARLWDAETGKPLGEPLKGHEGLVLSAAFSPDGRRIVTASRDRTARLWDAETGEPLGEPLKGHEERVVSAAFSPDGRRIVTASWDKTARLWDAETGKPLGEPLQGQSAAFSPDGRRIVTASGDRTARLWDVETGKPIGEPLKGHEDVVWSAAFSPDGRRIVTASEDDTARLWDAENGKPIGEPLKGHEGQVRGAVFSPDGRRIVTASVDDTARLWDAETGKPIGEPLQGQGAAFSPDGRRIVTASGDKTARLWDAETGKPIGEPLKGHEGAVLSAAFSPDGRRIVTASEDRTARLWDAETGKPIGEPLKGHEGAVLSAAFSPDGRRILTASEDRTARLWDAETGKPIGEPLKGHEGEVLSAAFSPDGRRIVTASWDDTARLWEVPNIDMKDRLPRCLSEKQLVAFKLPTTPPRWCIEMNKYPYFDPRGFDEPGPQ